MAIQSDLTYPSSSLTDTARSIATTLRKNLRKREACMLRKRILPALIQDANGVEGDVGGAGVEWPVQDRIHDDAPNDGTNRREFAPQNLYRNANLQFGGMEVKDSIKTAELLANRGREAVIRVADTMRDRLEESFMEKFAEKFYHDGDSTSYKLYGIESMMAVQVSGGSNAALDDAYDWGTAGATPSNTIEDNAVGDPIMVPSDVYAGLNTKPGSYGGAQESGGWPEGKASAQFDFWSPLIINTNSTFFGAITSGTGWQDNAVEAIRFGLIHAKRNTVDDEIDITLMDRTLLYQLQNQLLSGVERVLVTSERGVRRFGFNNTFYCEGVECATEYGIPTTTVNRAAAADFTVKSAYGFSTRNIKIMSRWPGITHAMEKNGEYDKETQSYDYCLEALLQFRFKSPRNFIKWAGFSATS